MTRSFWNWLAISTLWLSTIFTPFTNVTLASDWDHVVWDKDSWEITVYSDDFSYGITLQDKNLWANNVWETWDYYQYWNNQPWNNEDEDTKNIWANYPSDSYWDNRWWQSDTFYIGPDGTIAGYDMYKHIARFVLDRKWPCNEWYHIPSAWEWSELIKLWCEQHSWCVYSENSEWFIFIPAGEYWKSFAEEMKLIAGGFLNNEDHNRYYDDYHDAWSIDDNGIYRNYWSSSLENQLRTNKSRRTTINFTNWEVISSSSTDWKWWQNVRCFKNEYMLTLSASGAEDKHIKFLHGLNPSQEAINNSIDQIETEVGLSEWQHIERYILNDLDEEIPFELKSENIPSDNSLTVYWKVKTNTYTIKFVDEEWNELMENLLVGYSNITTWQIENYTWIKEWYTFKWWKDNYGNLYADWEEITNNLSLIDGDIIYFVAQWEQINKNWWYSGGWGGSHTTNSNWSTNNQTWVNPQIIERDKESSPNNLNDEWNAANEWDNKIKITDDDYDKYWKDLIDSYSRAYEKGLTKYINIEDVRLNDWLNRQEMAKISSIFAIEFLGKNPDESKQNFCSQYLDMWKVDNEMKFFISQSCELWYMWYESNWIDTLRNFRPYTELTLAEASTILSRIVRWNKYMMNWKWRFLKHLYAVYEKWLIDDIEDPYAIITRWDVYKMLYRLSLLND